MSIFIKKLPIKTKLVLIILLASIVALVLESAAFIAYERFRAKQEITQNFTSLLRIISEQSIPSLVVKDYTTAQDNLAVLKAKRAIVAASIYDVQGNILARYNSGEERAFDFPTGANLPAQMQVNDGYLYLDEPIIDKGVLIGSVFMRASLRELDILFHTTLLFSVLMIFTTSIVILIIAMRLQRIVSEPIGHLISTVQTVTANKDYRVRLQEESSDEFGSLVLTFNQMLDTIENYDHELVQSNQRLATFEQDAHYPPELLSLESLHVGEGIQRVGGKIDDYRKQLHRFREHYATATQELKRLLLTEKDMMTGEDYCNALKGITGNIGAKSLYQCVVRIGTRLKQAQLPDVKEFEEMQTLLDAIIKDIDSLSITETLAPMSPQQGFSQKILLTKTSALLVALENDLGQTENLLRELHAGTVGSEFELLVKDIAAEIDVFNIDQAATLLMGLQQRLSIQS